ncbi:unnamed protein product [Umbelopsis sp. WA50703]
MTTTDDATAAFDLLRDDLSADIIQAELQKILNSEDLETVKADVETRFLIPQTTFPATWLGPCQQHWEEKPDLKQNVDTELQKGHTEIELARDGLDGKVLGYHEVTSRDADLTAKNSTSLQRQFGDTKNFVRGKGNNFPFAPGGIENVLQDSVDAMADGMLKEKDILFDFTEDHLLSKPPGLERGLLLANETDGNIEHQTSAFDFDTLMRSEDIEIELLEKPIEQVEQMAEPAPQSNVETDEQQVTAEESGDIDSLLPTENLIAKESVARRLAKRQQQDARNKKRDWAHEINANEPFENFHELVPEMAHDFPFELDNFQKHAVYHLEIGDSVFVAAHTSAGKTAVAEYAISLATKHMTKAIYTSPIKALSNQKFRDFKKTYGDDVGILTGDVQINPEASCLIMTTEILRSMLYRGADLLRDVEFVIFDEVHYVNDLERGVVWEEVIIMLPAHVNLILLSATVPNTKEFADWVGRTKKKDIYVISTMKRPVPLEHHLYANKELFKIVGAHEQKINQISYKMAVDALTKKKDPKEVASQRGGRGGRGGMAKAPARTPQRSYHGAQQTDRNMFVHMVGVLSKKNLLPVVIFTFSKKKCEEYASALSNVDLNSSTEKSEIHIFFEKSVARLRGSDRQLPQVIRTKDLLSRGVAVHHSGLLPIIKEIVEILFSRGLVKVLFATETFAMGVNMPTRSVVFSGIRKHDGQSFRDLLPGEYTQMSGRAGRRGLDDTGVVIIACSGETPPDQTTLSTMLLGKPTKLQSQFRLTYNMILNLLRVEALKVEEMIKRSFSENTSQRLLPDTEKLVNESELSLSKLKQLDCTVCSTDIQKYYDLSSEVITSNRKMAWQIAMHPAGHRALTPGRVTVVNNAIYPNAAAVILQPASAATAGITGTTQADRYFHCLILVNAKHMGSDQHVQEHRPLPVTDIDVPSEDDCRIEIALVPLTDFLFVTTTSFKINADALMNTSDKMESAQITKQLLSFAGSSKRSTIAEFDWSKIKDMDFQENWKKKQSLLRQMGENFQCVSCPDLEEHYSLVHAQRRLQAQIDNLKMTISDQNLELLPDYQQRVEVLKNMSYIDSIGTVQLKGRVACEINTADELLLTELIFDNVFADYEPAEIVALLSCFVFHERSDNEPSLTPKLQQAKDTVIRYAETVGERQYNLGVEMSKDEYVSSFKFTLVEVVYEWARGMPFKHITDLTDVLEGSIVRAIVRLDETCREVKSAARMIGDPSLFKKMEEAELLIKRDIVFAASLYF